MGILDHNGEGQSITEFDSNRIGHIALRWGRCSMAAGGTANLDIAAAAQAAIWDIAYNVDGATSITSDTTIASDIAAFIGDHFSNVGYAQALIPLDPMDNQLMITGLSARAPEPSTWAMGVIGFAVLGTLGYRRRT